VAWKVREHRKENIVNQAIRLATGAVLGGVALLALLALALGSGGGALAQETDSLSLQLTPSRDSGVSGTATLTDVGEGVKVELNMRGLPEAGIEHINHFHAGGSCTADRAGNVAPATIPLKTIVAKEDGTGSGTTTLKDVTLDQLFDPGKERYIALHSEVEKGQGVPPVISCADVVEAAGSGAVSTTLPESGGPRPAMLLATAVLLSLGAAAGVVRLVRRGS
jgi:Cu/Zn superoxide dismutase